MTHSSQPPSSILAALLVVVGACATGSEGPSAADAALPAGHPPLSAVDKESGGPHTEAGPASEPANSLEGTVKETMNGGGYTYALVSSGEREVWVAVPDSEVVVGDTATVRLTSPMKDFKSRALDRTFDLIYFAAGLEAPDGDVADKSHRSVPATATPATATEATIKIDPLEGGHTVAALFASHASLSGQPIAVRGKVVKSNSGIMGTNWIHLRDGSGSAEAGTHDLTVTTDAVVEVGATVIAKGTLSTDRDFGAGYHYAVIVEGAAITVE